jgi:hypothetical protein
VRVRVLAGWMLVAAAIACAGAAVAASTGRRDGGAAPLVTAEKTPATVAPRFDPATTAPTIAPATTEPPPPTMAAPAPAATPTTTTTTTLPRSPLRRLLGDVRSARPRRLVRDVEPVALTIADLGLDGFPVAPVGVTGDGQLEIPDETRAGWYRLGAAPGQRGATVIAAHVSWQGHDGPFLRLAELQPGAAVEVRLADGSARRYQVVERAQHGKLVLPARTWRTSGPETLVLITCGGAFDEEIRRYADNIVVTAVPVG